MKKIGKNRRFIWSLAAVLALSLLSPEALAKDTGGSGTKEDPYRISTAEELTAVREDLDAFYILEADIDLSGYEDWIPIGTFMPMEEGSETPDPAYAFTGSFDGSGHKVTGLSIVQPEGMLLGLFGCVSEGTVANLTIAGAEIQGNSMAAAAIGYVHRATVDNVDVEDSEVAGKNTEELPANMVACVVAAGMESTLIDCDVKDSRVVLDGGLGSAISQVTHDAGLVGGGLEAGSMRGCTVSGSSVQAGDNCMGIGGLSGCAMSFTSVEACSVQNTNVAVGDNAQLTGGLLGYTGAEEDAPTAITGCTVTDSKVVSGKNAYRVGGMLGGGFYFTEYKAYFPTPVSYAVDDSCAIEGTSVTAGAGSLAIGMVAGHSYVSSIDAAVSNTSVCVDETETEDPPACGVEETDKSKLLYEVADTYQQLFEGATFLPTYDHYWHDYSAAIVGEDNAEVAVEMLKRSIGGTIYGLDAEDAYTANPEATQFFCGFTNNLSIIAFHGARISGYTEDGTVVFSHTYEYLQEGGLYGPDPAGGEEDVMYMPMTIFQSTNEESGDFTYFALCGDTPDTTYHIEFRYGADLDALQKYNEGQYAYWLAAGIPTSALMDEGDTLISKAIELFCTENLTAEEKTEEEPGKETIFFTDVPAWAEDAVQYVCTTGLMAGEGDQFHADSTVTGKDLTGALEVLCGKEVLSAPAEDPLTREATVAALYRCALEENMAVEVSGSLSAFSDAVDVRAEAMDAMCWAVGSGLIAGVGGDQLHPQAVTTRAQLAVMLARFCENTVNAK